MMWRIHVVTIICLSRLALGLDPLAESRARSTDQPAAEELRDVAPPLLFDEPSGLFVRGHFTPLAADDDR